MSSYCRFCASLLPVGRSSYVHGPLKKVSSTFWGLETLDDDKLRLFPILESGTVNFFTVVFDSMLLRQSNWSTCTTGLIELYTGQRNLRKIQFQQASFRRERYQYGLSRSFPTLQQNWRSPTSHIRD